MEQVFAIYQFSEVVWAAFIQTVKLYVQTKTVDSANNLEIH